MKSEYKTIKVLESSVSDLNVIAALSKEKQYETVERLAKSERERLEKAMKKSK